MRSTCTCDANTRAIVEECHGGSGNRSLGRISHQALQPGTIVLSGNCGRERKQRSDGFQCRHIVVPSADTNLEERLTYGDGKVNGCKGESNGCIANTRSEGQV